MTPEEELRYFNALTEIVPYLMDGKIVEQGMKDSWPDFVYQTKTGNKIAVELTEVSNDKYLNERIQDEQEQILSKSLDAILHELDIKKKFHYEITLKQGYRLTKKQHTLKLANDVAHMIMEKLPESKFAHTDEIDPNPSLGVQIEPISLYFSENLTSISGIISSKGLIIPSIKKEEIKKSVEDKSCKYMNSKANVKFDEAWLVLVMTEKAATWRDYCQIIENWEFKSPYDKIILHDFFIRSYMVLNSQRPD